MPDFPVEIWFHVASFLSGREIERLLGFNKVFLELALNRRYKDVCLGPWFSEEEEKQIPRFLKHLSLPFVSSRIRRVYLPLQPRLLKAHSSTDELHALLDRMLDRIRPGRGHDRSLLRRSRSTTFGVDPRAIKLFSLLHNVHSLVLTEYIFGNYTTPPIVALSWLRLGHNLRELDIRARPQKAADLLSSAPDLPNLQIFKLEFKRDPYYLIPAINDVSALQAIPRFLRGVAPTLKQLKVIARNGPRQLAFRLVAALVLRDVGQLPHLERFTFDVTYDEDKGHGWPVFDFFRFLKANDDNLRHLSVPPVPILSAEAGTAEYSQGFCPTNLESFTLLQSFPALPVQVSLDSAKAYVRASRETLVSIKLLDQHLYVSELEEILSQLPSFAVTPPLLRHLSIKLVALGPDVLDLLAEGLPYLTNLSMFFTSVVFHGLAEPDLPLKPGTSPSGSEICSLDLIGFKADMQARKYTQWNLSTLVLGNAASKATLTTISDTLKGSIPALAHVYQKISANDH